MKLEFYEHEIFCKKCDKVVSKFKSYQKELSKEDREWHEKYHKDMVHGTKKDRDYYKRFDRPKG